MPGMKLNFLKNPAQRVATGKSLPLKQVEAILLYGKPEQKAKVIQKLLPSTYGLSLNKTTHHVLISLLDHADNMARVQMLYNVRRKILDLCTSPVGNVVLQHMLEKVPLRQKKEIAEGFVLNVEEDEFRRLCEHPFGNHVAQKLMEYPDCAAILAPRFVPYILQLSSHAYGMRVVAKYIECVEGGWKNVVEALFPRIDMIDKFDDDLLEDAVSDAMDKAVARLFGSLSESMVIVGLLRHLLVPNGLKDAIVAHLSEYAEDYLDPRPSDKQIAAKKEEEEFAMPDFGSSAAGVFKKEKTDALAPKHIHTMCGVFEHAEDEHRRMLWEGIKAKKGLLAIVVSQRATVSVAVAAVKFFEASRADIYAAVQSNQDGKKLSIVEVAMDPVRSMILRAFIDVDVDRVTKAQRQELFKGSFELSMSPVGSPVLQKLLEADAQSSAGAIYKAVQPHLAEMLKQTAGSFLIQSLLQFSDDELRSKMVDDVLEALGDLHDTLAYAQGSRVMQKLLAYAPDEEVVKVVNNLVSQANLDASDSESDDEEADDEEGEDDEEAEDDEEVDDEEDDEEADEEAEKEAEKEAEVPTLSRKEQRLLNKTRHYEILSNSLSSYALHNHACYVIQALLRETRTRQLDRERRLIMNELKPHVFELAVSPWAGRVVLDTMMQVGSTQLAEAMKNVVFLKAESWLSDVSEERKSRGNGVDPTIRNILKRQRENVKEGKSSVVDTESAANSEEPKKKQRKVFRSLKK